ncbi:MAG: ECF transporter S component [Clostridia bacterium]
MKQTSVKTISLVGVMAAMIFVATAFIHIPIPSPTGMTMIKTGNILCLLAGLLLGKVNGGFAAGLGSMFYDLTNPLYISSAPTTFINFFLMAFICGLLFEKIGQKSKFGLVISCVVGAFSYVVLYFSKSVLSTCLVGSLFVPAVIANLTKLATSTFNATIATIFAIILYPIFIKILTRANIISDKKATN